MAGLERRKEVEGKRRVGTSWFHGLVDTVYGGGGELGRRMLFILCSLYLLKTLLSP